MRFKRIRITDKKSPDLSEPYNLSVPFQDGWNRSDNRALVVLDYIQSSDLYNKELLSSKSPFTKAYLGVINEAERIASRYGHEHDWRYTFYNFNYFKSFHLDANKQNYAKHLAEKRLKKYIDKIKPTLIITLGDEIADRLLSKQNMRNFRGVAFNYKGIPVVNTLSMNLPSKSSAFDKDLLKKINTLGYMSRNIATGLMKTNPLSVARVTPSYTIVDTMQEFKRMMSIVSKSKAVAIDTETENLNIHNNKVLTVQFAVESKHAYILPVYHKDSAWNADQLSIIESRLKKFFSNKVKQFEGNKTRYFVGQNFGFDLRVIMKWLNIPYIYYPVWDLMSGEYLYDENVLTLIGSGIRPFALDQIAAHYGNDFYFREAAFNKKDRSNIKDYPLKDIADYCAMDVQLPFAIHMKQKKRFKTNGVKGFNKLMLLHQSGIVKMTSLMEFRGTHLDIFYILDLLKPDSALVKNMDGIVKQFYSLPEVKEASDIIKKRDGVPQSLFANSKHHFSLSDMKHKRTLFIDVLKLKPLKVSAKTKNPSFDIHFLKEYASKHKSVDLLLRLSKLKTLKSTFIDAFYQHISESDDGKIDGRIRPSFGSCSTVTGRSNSSNPSLQQIPEHSGDAKIAKRMLVVPKMHLHFEADYSAHEVRCWGIISKDKTLAKVFKTANKSILQYRKDSNEKNKKRMLLEGDTHKQTYSFFTGVDIADVDKSMRQQSKGITFGLVYGMSDKSLSVTIDKSLSETKRIREKFFAQFKDACQWLAETKRHARKHYWTKSPLGRRRNLYGYMSNDDNIKYNLDRFAMNSPVQGFASDISFIAADIYTRELNRCLIKLDRVDGDLPPGPNAFVHDSLKGEALFDLFLMNLHLIEWSMTEGVKNYFRKFYNYDLSIPLAIEFEIGSDWSNKKKWDWSRDMLDELIVSSVGNHKKLYPTVLEIQRLDEKKILNDMKKAYRQQKKLLKLDERYPIGSTLTM